MNARLFLAARSLFATLAAIGTTAAFAADVAPVIDRSSCESPKYPKAALINEESGTVTLGFLVSADGKVSETKVEKSSGSRSLDKAAATALALCKFKPGTKDGKADAAWVKIDFTWKLE